jgi:hypothetical protein
MNCHGDGPADAAWSVRISIRSDRRNIIAAHLEGCQVRDEHGHGSR